MVRVEPTLSRVECDVGGREAFVRDARVGLEDDRHRLASARQRRRSPLAAEPAQKVPDWYLRLILHY